MSSHCSNYNTNPSAKSLRILVVDDDLTCLTVIAAILKRWNYEVVTIKHPIDALCILRINHGGFDLVIIDVHMPQMNGFELLKLVNEEFKLPVVLMSADDKEAIMVKAIERGAEYFIVKPITPDDVRGLWKYTAARKKIHEATSKNSIIFPGKSLTYSTPEKYDQLQTKRICKKISSRKVSSGDDKEDINFSRSTVVEGKKGKVVWTNALHDKFLQAIRTIGLQNAVPKKILEIMDVPGLTRENVASHLQKYRIFLHRVSDLSFGVQFQRTNMSKKSFQSNSLSGSRPHIMHNKLIPSHKEIYEAEPPVLDTSRELGNTSFPVLETSSYKANIPSAYTSIGSSSDDSSPVQNAFDAVIETNTAPKTLGNGGGVGEDDSVFGLMNIYSPSLDTIFSSQAYADDDDLGSLFVNQSDAFPSLNQVRGGEEELGIFDCSSLASKHTGNASPADKILNEHQKPAKEAMAADSFYSGNNQYPNGYFPVVNPNFSQDNGDEEDFLDSMFGPGPHEMLL